MRNGVFGVAVVLVLSASLVRAQATVPATREADPGVFTTPVMDRAEMRASRLEMGQVYFLDKGTPHMFTNAGTSSAGAIEVFVKPRAFASPAGAPPAPAPSTAAAPPTREVDPGVFNASPTLNRAEMDAGRVEVKPGATRRPHQHNDVQFHLFIPISGTIRLTMNGETTDAVEVFVKPRE